MNPGELKQRFEAGTIQPGTFDHNAHVHMAWLYLAELTVPQTMTVMRDGLRTIAEKAGHPEKYHETMTCAFVSIIAERRQRGKSLSWQDFQSRNADLFHESGQILNKYYRPETLSSELARTIFILPDAAQYNAA